MAQEYFDNPDNRRRLIKQGADIAMKAVVANKTEMVAKVVEIINK